MRILFTTRGNAGHIGPLAPVAHAARAAGHEVLVATRPSQAADAERLGLPYATTADAPEDRWGALMAQLPVLPFDAANALMIGEFFGGLDTEAALEPLDALVADWRPDVLVRETWEFASELVAERRGLPIVRVGLGLADVEALTTRVVAPVLDRLRAERGLPADPEGARLAATPWLSALPASVDTGAVPARTVRFRRPAPAPQSLAVRWDEGADLPLVYVTFGSVAAGSQLPLWPALYRGAVEAFAPLGARVLLTVGAAGDPEALGPLPANVRVARWIPQDAVLAEASVVVGHGGHGTTLGALEHGVPQVVVPLFSVDQWHNARAVGRAGTGVCVGAWPTGPLRPAGVEELEQAAREVARMLAGSPHATVAERIAGEIAALPPVDVAVERVIAEAAAAQVSG